MRIIGYWIKSLRDPDYFPPQEFVGEQDAEVKRQLADYLDTGQIFVVYRGFSWCRFFCEHPGGSTELSDGYWVWPNDLSHYVRNHEVILPDEFVQHVRSGIPRKPKDLNWDSIRPDVTFWKDWCRRNASGKYRARLAGALLQANAEAQRVLADQAKKLETEKGMSDAICNWAGCTNHCMSGKELCARCMIKGKEEIYISHLYCDLRAVLDG